MPGVHVERAIALIHLDPRLDARAPWEYQILVRGDLGDRLAATLKKPLKGSGFLETLAGRSGFFVEGAQ